MSDVPVNDCRVLRRPVLVRPSPELCRSLEPSCVSGPGPEACPTSASVGWGEPRRVLRSHVDVPPTRDTPACRFPGTSHNRDLVRVDPTSPVSQDREFRTLPGRQECVLSPELRPDGVPHTYGTKGSTRTLRGPLRL